MTPTAVPGAPPAPGGLSRRGLLFGGLAALVTGCASSRSPGAAVVGTAPPGSGTPAAPTTAPFVPGELRRRTGTSAPDLPPGPGPSAPGTLPPSVPDGREPAPPGSEPTAPDGTPSSGRPRGALVLHNSTYVAVLDVATGDEVRTEPRQTPFIDPGVGVWRGGRISMAVDVGRDGFELDLYDRSLVRVGRLAYVGELAFLTSAATFDATGAYVAYSVDELTSASDDTRIVRTVVQRVADGEVVARHDGVEEPVWTGTRGELIVRETDGSRVRVIDPSGRDAGPIPDVRVASVIGAYDVSADGRYLVWEDGTAIRALDRDTGRQWVAAEDRISDCRAPTLSPDGGHLAFLTNVREEDAPHVVPFAVGRTVAVDSALHARELSFVNVRGRIGWMA